MGSPDPERRGDGAEPRWIRSDADLRPSASAALAALAALEQAERTARRAEDRVNLVIGGLLLGAGATIHGRPVVWDLHWPEGMPPGWTAEGLRELGASMVRAAGGDPRPGPARPVATALEAALGLIRAALTLHAYGPRPAGLPAGAAEETDWPSWVRRARDLLAEQDALADAARGAARQGHGEE